MLFLKHITYRAHQTHPVIPAQAGTQQLKMPFEATGFPPARE
jgi:hypothetical protein